MTQANFGSGALMAADNKLIIADATPEKYTERARAQVIGGKCWPDTVMAVVGIWATNIFDLPTPRFKNAQNDEADFRLNTFNTQLFVRKVTLRPRE